MRHQVERDVHVDYKEHYRPAVDGLRGIAVLSVILFHIDPGLLPGGFVGVDVFFVISGFLISLNILREVAEGRFSIGDFYRRRIKRIAPALLLVLCATVIAAQWFLGAVDAERAAESGLWSLLSLGNVYFWLHQDTSYFAAASNEKPLLHLWSLGVEEQFYLIWPLVLLACAKVDRTLLALGMAVVALGSIALAAHVYPTDASFSYYMLPTRAGELLIGAIVAVIVMRWPVLLRRTGATVAASVGLILLVVSLFWIDERVPFPGWTALLPTLGTALLIYSDHCGRSWVTTLLTVRPLWWVGLVSYSAYLWHWPLLAFWRYGYREVEPTAACALFALTFALAWATYRWVETPARRFNGSVLRVACMQFALPASAVALFCLVAMRLDGLTFRPGDREELRPVSAYEYVCQVDRLDAHVLTDPRCVTGARDMQPSVLLLGDSNAAHYIGMLTVIAEHMGVAIRNATVSSCPPIDQDPSGLVDAKRLADCRASQAALAQAVPAYRTVILAGSWTGYAPGVVDAAAQTARRLASEGHQVIILGKSPVVPRYDRDCAHKVRAFPGGECPSGPLENSRRVSEVNQQLRQWANTVPGVVYFDANDLLCPDGKCPQRNDRGDLVFFDRTHLTMKASWTLGEAVVMHGIPDAFRILVPATVRAAR